MSNKTYRPVPVEAAKALSVAHGKAIIVICAWDHDFKCLHTTTYGESPQDKIAAAKGGEVCAAGSDLTRKTTYEDFADPKLGAAKNAKLREVVVKHLPALKEMAAQIISPKDNIFAEIVRDLEACL